MKHQSALFILLLLSVLASAQQNIPYGKNAAVGKYYDIRGFKMYCETYGSGAPLLLIHGNGGSIESFAKQIPYFSKKYQVIVADSRAQGKPTDKNDSLSYKMMADDFAELLTQLKIESANVIGWSDGGINGLLLAIRHPEKVKKLAITGANIEPDTTAITSEMLKGMMDEAAKMKAKPNQTDADKNAFKLLQMMIDQPHIPVSDLHKITAPTLVIGGDHDLIKPAHTLHIFQSIPNAFLWILPNAGHSTLIDYSVEFNLKVGDFFNLKK